MPRKPAAAHTSPAAQNRKARFDVDVEETFEAGIRLTGDEIKSIRSGRMQLQGSFVRLTAKGAEIINLQLTAAAQPTRPRALLLHATELETLGRLTRIKGLAIVALNIHFKRGWAKVLVGVGKGRKAQDKRHLLRERDLERESSAQLKKG